MDTPYDVVICGAGLAGLTLTRQLNLQMPELSVLLLDKAARPLPEATLKVGESTVIIGAAYLQKVLELGPYLARAHIEKLGLRYFFPAPSTASSFSERPELGRGTHNPHTTEWQLDRGIFENDLRAMAEEASGVELEEGASVTKIHLSETDAPHEISFRQHDRERRVEARWVIDATGRRRFLQKQLGAAKKPVGRRCSAAWFRVPGRIDVDDLVPASDQAWHARVPGAHPRDETYGRYNSTNHIMGTGYWVWLIPLSSGCTSIGIVTLEEAHPFSSYNTRERALSWLATHEPAVADRIDGVELLDFLVRKDYSYTCDRVLSPARWACTGEAGCFPDPFYSPGTDSIAFTNCAIAELIRKDRAGEMTGALVDELNADYLTWVRLATENIHAGYRFLGDPVVGSAKIIWDFCNFWFNAPRFFSMLFQPGFSDRLAEWKSEELGERFARLAALKARVLDLFDDWTRRSGRRATFGWIDYFNDLDFLQKQALIVTTAKATPLPDFLAGFERVEALALAFFLLALEDVMPEELRRLRESGRAGRLNPLAIGLRPDRWAEDGLFAPEGDPRDYEEIYRQLRGVYQFSDR